MDSLAALSLTFLCFLALTNCTNLVDDHFVEEIGDENEVISIEEEPLLIPPRVRRQADFSSYEDSEEGSGGQKGNFWDLDESYDQDEYDEEESEDDFYTPVMPTRVVPTPVSPTFGQKTMIDVTRPQKVENTEASKSMYDEFEGSGNEDYEGPSTIIPTQVIENMATKPPEMSPTFQPEYTHLVTTERLPLDQKPYVQKKLRKYAVTAGRPLRILIPEDTFMDNEDGATRSLRLQLRNEDGSQLKSSWLRFDHMDQSVFALPVDENGIGRYKFRLVATDKLGQSVYDTLEIVVRQYPGARLINHQFTLEFSFTDWDPESTRGWQWRMLDKITKLYGDVNPENILVRKVGENPYVFAWTNDTLTVKQTCPKGDIRRLFSHLIEEDKAYKSMYGSASRDLKELLGDAIYVKSVHMSYHGTCLRDDNLNSVPDGNEDSVPVIRNPIDRINVTAGELLRYKVPEDTCYDKEDGKTPDLNLHLLATNRRELSPDAWLQFDERSQEFVGIPLEEEVGREEYQLVCSDRNGISAIDGIEVIVLNRPFNERFGVEFALQFGPNDYGGGGINGISGQPILRRSMKVRIVQMLATFFGDSSTSNVILKTFDADNGRVVWHNKSLAHQPCDSPTILWVRDQMVTREAKVRPRLVRHFQPYLRLIDADVVKQGQCLTGIVPPVPTGGTDNSHGGSNSRDTIFHGIIPSADYLLTFIIPAVIITCMLILAILLACVLHKKRKAGKLNLFYSEALPPRVPVILQDELYDEHEMGGGHKQPVLLREDINTNGGAPRIAEHDKLLQQHHNRPIQIDPYGRGSLSRPTPAYQRRQL